MRFIDEVQITVRSGNGGRGCVSFRREKFRPRGGPDGGNGGDGGEVLVRADPRLTTLLDLRYKRTLAAANGRPGEGNDRTGAKGRDLEVRVPVGTQIHDVDQDTLLVDLDTAGARYVVARGGRGGRGNAAFASATRRSPEKAQLGDPGQEVRLRFVLKLMADVGLVGLPNAGKSTLISRLSRARPKIADYPFTTLVPNLGVVELGPGSSFVMADIPGLIEGAASGAGLGHQFLRHIERTRVFVHLVTQDLDPSRSPLADYRVLRRELAAYDPGLLDRPHLVAVAQVDRPEVEAQVAEVRQALSGEAVPVLAISAVSGAGLDDLRRALQRALSGPSERA